MNLKLMEVVSTQDFLSEEKIIDALKSSYIKDYAYILHDKDLHSDGSEKSAHWHIAVRLRDSTDTKYIAQAFGVPENFVGRVKGKWVDVLEYLTHSNSPEKYQYPSILVNSNFDFEKTVSDLSAHKVSKKRLETIIEGIDTGKIREYNYTEYISMQEYVKYKKHIESAFRYRLDTLKGVNRLMDCIFLTGASQSGKTTYAKMLAEDKGYSVFISSGSNDVLDGYQGQDCIILDDLRPSCMGLSDLLKMLDNHTASSVKSRYKNKVLECKLIIITSVLPIDEFFRNVFDNENEPIVQLKRRCKLYAKLTRDNIQFFIYSNVRRDYIPFQAVPNPVKTMFVELTDDELWDYAESLLGGTVELVKELRGTKDLFLVEKEEEVPF